MKPFSFIPTCPVAVPVVLPSTAPLPDYLSRTQHPRSVSIRPVRSSEFTSSSSAFLGGQRRSWRLAHLNRTSSSFLRFDALRIESIVAPDATKTRSPQETYELLKKELSKPEFHADSKEMFDLYAENMVYEDASTRVEGREKFRKMVVELGDVFPNITLDLLDIKLIPDNKVIKARWTMSFAFGSMKWFPTLWVTGVTDYILNDQGLIQSHLDRWDSVPVRNSPLLGFGDMLAATVPYVFMKTADVEQPKYLVVRRFKGFEVRQYEPYVLAEVPLAEDQVDRTRGRSAFQSLAGYIFGNNARQEKMAMTAPVITTRPDLADTTARSMAFVMESKFGLAELPQPVDGALQLKRQDKERVAVIKFRGNADKGTVRRKLDELLAGLKREGIQVDGNKWRLAQYNDPSTAWWERTNEVFVPVVLSDHIQ